MKKVALLVLGFIGALTTSSFAQSAMADNLVFGESKAAVSDGEKIAYFANGNKKMTYNVAAGQVTGLVTFNYENGAVKETGMMTKGMKNGTWEKFNQSGKKISIASFKNDQKDGVWQIWDDNGILRYQMQYDNGKKTGLWKIYDDKGTLVEEKTY